MLLAVLACFCLVQDAAAWTKISRNDRPECIRRNGNIGDAIMKFCRGNPKIVRTSKSTNSGKELTYVKMVPSPYAKEGVWSSQGKVSAWIRGSYKRSPLSNNRSAWPVKRLLTLSFLGTCKPKQLVPEGYCLAQMWNMCVNMGPKGKARARYGRAGCQDWHLKVF